MVRFGQIQLPDPFQRTRKDPDMELEFRALSGREKCDLSSFFKCDALGMEKEWNYTDIHGTRRVRFNESALVFVEYSKHLWDVTVLLIIT